MTGSEVVIATLMRQRGGSGLQSHVRTFDEYLRDSARPVSIVSPFEARSPFVLPVFAGRLGIRPVSRPAAVWWHQYWHAHYLKAALRTRLAARPDAVIYAQCPISAGVALQVRRTQPVVMVAHFNISQADEWADEGEIPRDGRLFGAIRQFEERVLSGLDGIVYRPVSLCPPLSSRLSCWWAPVCSPEASRRSWRGMPDSTLMPC